MVYKGWENFDPDKTANTTTTEKPSKYHNKHVVVDGMRFDSKREAHRWHELKMALQAKQINSLERQVSFKLTVLKHDQIEFETVGRYVADFTYFTKEGKFVVEDVKGVKTELYKWKKKHMRIEHGIDIQEV